MAEMESRKYAKLDGHARMLEREGRRAQNAAADLALSQARLQRREKRTIQDRVDEAIVKLRNRNVPATIALIESVSSSERDAYLLAEEIGQNRKTVLQSFPNIRKSARIAYFGPEKVESV